jgi:hypothetical protein
MPELTPRWVLQHWGTEVCRHGFHDDIWIASLENKLRHSEDDVVISDCRFPNEIAAIRRANGLVVRVVRGPEPEWYDSALAFNHGEHKNMLWSTSKARLIKLKIHASETAWVGTKFDAVLDNNGSLDDLYLQIQKLTICPAQDPLHAKASQP